MDEKLLQKIAAVKATRMPVFSVVVSGDTYIYRGINRKEFKHLQAKMTKAAEELRVQFPKKEDETKLNSELSLLKEKSEEELVVLALIDPPMETRVELDALPAGLITRLADLITVASGFVDVPEEPKQL